MSDFGISDAITNSNNSINTEVEKGKDARLYNNTQKNTYDNSINTAKGTKQTENLESEGKLGATGVGGVVKTGKTIADARASGVLNYVKAQPALAAENLKGAGRAAAGAFGLNTEAAGAVASDVRPGAAPLFSSGPGAGRSMGVVGGAPETLGGRLGTAASDVRAAGGNSEDTGLVSSFASKALGAITDLKAGQVAGIAKGVGFAAAIGGAAITGIEDISTGSTGGSEGKSATGAYKAGNDASLVAGGLDVAASVVPILAPVAAAASVAAGVMGIIGSASEDAQKKKKAAATYASGKESFASDVVSQTASGDVASASTAQRTY
tara:strand:- start:142 stop:1110 length:969 start_codon:yes stop_codon:yes gene_type:complete